MAGLAGASGGGGAAATSIDSAGGIGGLLGVLDTAATTSSGDDVNHVFLYDANGNVGQLVDAAGSGGSPVLTARYEYDAYGNIIGPDTDADGDWTDDAGTYATVNPWRFSTRSQENGVTFCILNERIYDPSMGRFLSRDKISELGDVHALRLLANANELFVADLSWAMISRDYVGLENSPVTWIDPTGRVSKKPHKSDPGPLHPGCCAAVLGMCLLKDGTLGPCWDTFNQCLAGNVPNPCHVGGYIDDVCWYVRGSQGCKKPNRCLLDLFPLCNIRLPGTTPKGNPLYGKHVFRFCSTEVERFGYQFSKKKPADCLEACTWYKKDPDQHAQNNCGCRVACEKCKDICKGH